MINPKRILIYRLGSLGDFVIILPCLHLIRRRFPNAQIHLLTNVPVSGKAAPAMAILEGTGICDGVFVYPAGTRNVKKLLGLIYRIRAGKFDMLINLAAARSFSASLRDYSFFKACGVGQVIGTPIRRVDLNRKKTNDVLYQSEAQRLADRIRQIGKTDLEEISNWSLKFTLSEQTEATKLLENFQIPFITISVGTKQPINYWGDDNWVRLFELLGEELSGVGLVLLGVEEESALSAVVAKLWPGPLLNLCGLASPRVSGVVMSRGRLFIGHDSGPMHLAAASGTAVVAIFSCHNPPGQWFPGHSSWQNIRVFYPTLPSGIWQKTFRESRPAGLELSLPEEVVAGVLALWKP